MEKVLQSFLRRLTNLSGSNRSLILLRLPQEQFIDLHELDFATGKPSFEIIKSLIARKGSIPLTPEINPRDPADNKMAFRVSRLSRVEQLIYQERGAYDLYVGWPFVRGKFSDDTLVRCPLIYFPVTLERAANMWTLRQRMDVNVTLNKTFLLAYAYYNKVSLDENLLEMVLTDLDADATKYRTQLYEIIRDSHLELNFNQDNFTDKLIPFASFKQADFEAGEKTGALKLYPEAVLGIFPQAGSYLVPDYVHLLEQEQVPDLADFFMSRKMPETDAGRIAHTNRVKEENTFTPFDSDASQEQALKEIKKGNSLVVQGPPGTGKSQLICNLVADYIARGKKVLVVCQKKAALDVVYSRLTDMEVHDFVGLVHDFKNDRKTIFDQIARQIERIDEYRLKNNGLDAIYLERAFLQASRRIDQMAEELEEFREALFDDTECGKSIKELYLSSNPSGEFFGLNQYYRQFHYHQLPDFLKRLTHYLEYHDRFDQYPSFWVDGPSFASFTINDLLRTREVLSEVFEFDQQLQNESLAFSKKPIDFETGLYFVSHLEDLRQLKTNLDQDLVFKYVNGMFPYSPQDLPWLANQERIMLNCFKGSGLEISLNSDELGRFQEALQHAINARRGLFKWMRWRLFSKDKIFVTRVLVANGLQSNKESFEILLQRIDNRLNFEHVLSEIKESKWLSDFPKNYRKLDIQNWFFYQKIALKCFQLFQGARTLIEFLPLRDQLRPAYVERLGQLITLVERIPAQLALWSRYLSEKQVRFLLLQRIPHEEASRTLNQDFDAVVEYHKIRDSFASEETAVLQAMLDHTEANKLALFENSLALAWIDHIEAKYPILRAVSSMKLDQMVRELSQAIEEKKKVSKDILLLKAREATYANLQFNRQNNPVTYRELQHQVTKKKQIWPIRRVISNHQEELFELLPCWMASPESASAIFPMEELFDLVIFDEASQCYAERGIPAMYRGSQVVIAGDDKQLQPHDLYQVRWQEEEPEHIDMEVDSLLSLAKNYLAQVQLTGHYRSKSLELIDFSNHHFYGGKLHLLPDFEVMNKREPAIHYRLIAGTWKQNQNLQEAEAVVDLVLELGEKQPQKSIGVVTFNAPQQLLILDLLDQKSRELNLPISDHLFVKNIENVQGDEKDIIIFSTGYAPDEKGKLQLKFGSLNRVGGENRLNVAVTRAREQIYMVTSLRPGDIKADDTRNEGPRLFAQYLEYAWSVSQKKWRPAPRETLARGQNWYLRNRIASMADTEIIASLPFADLTVRQADQYRGLILTDDEIYYQSISVKEIHTYRPRHFTAKRWPYLQLFSREFWLNPAQVHDKLDKFLHRVLE